MTQQLATLIYLAGIIGLFYLDRDAKARTSRALWIPVLWLMIIGSRPVSMWFQAGPTISQADQYTEGSPIDAAVFGILIAAGLLVLGTRSHQVGRVLRENLPIVLFFSYCAFSIAWSDYSFVAFKRWVKAIGDLVMVLIVLTDRDRPAAIKQLFSRAAFVLLPLSVLFIKYYPNIGRSYDPWSYVPMYSGVTTFKNLLGMICLVCGLGSLWSFLGAYDERKMPHRIRHLAAHGIVLATTAWLLLIANSMTSLTCFAMAGAVMFISGQRWASKRAGILNTIVGSCVALSLFSLFVDPSTMLSSLGRDPTLTGRTAIWHAVLSIHTNPLLGTGFESFWLGSRLERVGEMTEKGIQEAHNGYLEVYLNLGFVGITLLAGVIVTGYRRALFLVRRDPQAGRIRMAFFTAGVIYSLTEAGFRMMSPIWLAFLLAVTFIPPHLQSRKGQHTFKSSVQQFAPTAEAGDVVEEFV